jgi:hypothetical protein
MMENTSIMREFHGNSSRILKNQNILYCYFAWGDGRSAATVFDSVYTYNDTQSLQNINLHPMVEVNGLVREVAEEDLDMAWKTSQFIPPIKKIVRDAIRRDYNKFYPKPVYPYNRFEENKPKDKPPYENASHPGLNIGMTRELTLHAIQAGGTKNSLRALWAEARMSIPTLEFPTNKLTPGTEKCALSGNTCSGQTCCGNKTSCVYVSNLDESYCIAAVGV